MSRDLGELLRETAAQPTRELDTGEVLSKARRQLLLVRTGAALGLVAALTVTAVLVWPWLDLGGTGVPLEVTDQPPRLEGEAPEVEVVGEPVQTASGGGWSVRISPGEDDRWCVTAVRETTKPWSSAGDPCWEIAVPAGVEHEEVITILGRATENGDQVLVGSADLAADEGVEVTLVDGSTRTAIAATSGRLPFIVWFVPLDGPIPVSVEARSSTGVLGSVEVPELAPPEMVESISDEEMQDLQALADQRGISLDTAIVHYSWRDDFSSAVQEIQQAAPESFAGAEIGGLDDVWVAFTGAAPEAALDIIAEFNRQYADLGVSVKVLDDEAVTEAQLTEAIESVHRSILDAPEVADASTTYDRQTGQITTRVVLTEEAADTTIDDLQNTAQTSLVDAVGEDLANKVTVSVERSHLPLGDSDTSR